MTLSAVILSLCLISVCTQHEDDYNNTTPFETQNISQTTENISDISDNFVLKVNEMAEGNWTASSDFISLFPLETLRNLASKNPVIDPQNKKLYMLRQKLHPVIPPNAFDASENWPRCANMILRVPKMLDANFSMGWVTAMASVLTDRLCILSRGVNKVELSPVETFQCCKRCCKKQTCEEGGDALMGWEFWLRNGIVSGEFSDLAPNITGCKPYSKDALHLPCQEECINGVPSPKFLNANVSNSTWRYKQEKSKFQFSKSIHVLPRNPDYIKSEIFEHGPVQTAFKLYQDFFTYRNGVYVHVFGEFIGYHSVKIIGWGTKNHLDYWLVVNVWGTKFGDNGTIKFLKGINHCEIEENVIGADYRSLNHQVQHSSSRNYTIAKSGTGSVLQSCHVLPFFIIAFSVYIDL